MRKYIIIVAGGAGSRMKSTLPKQFIQLCGTPILMHTIENFYQFDPTLTIILVLPADQFEYWGGLCQKHHFHTTHQVIAGGETRFHSVKNALNIIDGEGLVAIHDGVRPLVSHETIARCFETAAKYGNATPCIAVHETVRQIKSSTNEMIDRSSLKLIQTPQVFSCQLIKKAFEQPYEPGFTDDASVLERTGETIRLVEGNRENIKVTEPLDLIVAEAILRNGIERYR
jgi:2-C-methyl-D-erythritol 4-phosphate cytidylyltransferase